MEIKQPSATFPGFRHIHRTLLPGESVPRCPTLLEQLQALRGSTVSPAPEAEEQAPEIEDGHEDEWSEIA